jgi:hypothetical protein
MNGLEEVERLKRRHRLWIILNGILGAGPIFAAINKFRPILTDGYEGDLLPTLLPDTLAAHYNAILAGLLGLLALSELARRRFYRVNEADLRL